MYNRISTTSGPTCTVLVLLLFLVAPARTQQSSSSVKAGGTAEVHGKVTITRGEEFSAEHLHSVLFGRYAAEGGGQARVLVDPKAEASWKLSERVVVYLEGEALNSGKYTVPLNHPLLDQKGLQFHPQVLPILVGTTVDFPNRDNLFHNVFSYSSPKEFDLGRYPQNDSRSVTFDRPGVVRVYCDIHSHMSATILVLQHPYFAVPGDQGDYRISNVPEGSYNVVLWYGRDIVERRPVTVLAGEAVVVNFRD